MTDVVDQNGRVVREGDIVRVRFEPDLTDEVMRVTGPREPIHIVGVVEDIGRSAGDVVVGVTAYGEDGWPNGRGYDCAPEWIERSGSL